MQQRAIRAVTSADRPMPALAWHLLRDEAVHLVRAIGALATGVAFVAAWALHRSAAMLGASLSGRSGSRSEYLAGHWSHRVPNRWWGALSRATRRLERISASFERYSSRADAAVIPTVRRRSSVL